MKPAQRTHVVRLHWLLVGFLLTGCAGEAETSRSVVVDSSGVRVVTNGATDIALPWTVRHVRPVNLPDSVVAPRPWMIASHPRAGRAYIIDDDASRIHVADSTGAIVNSWGRSGRGPHEMAMPVALDVTAAGEVIVVDALRQLLIRWTGDGEPVDELPLPIPYWGPGFATFDQAMVLTRSVRNEIDPLQLGQELVRVEGESVQVLASLPQNMTMAELPCMRRPIPKAFAASIMWAASDSRVYHIVWPHYRIDVHEGGTLVSSIRRDIEPVEVTDSMAIREIETGQLRRLLQMCGVDAETVLRQIGHEPFASPIAWLAVDPSENVWVWQASAGHQRVDVFDATGEYLGTVHDVPMPVAFLSSSRFLAVRDPFDNAALELWSVAGVEQE